MNTWTIGKRITVGGGILCILLLLLGATTLQNLHGIRKDAVSLNGDSMPGLIASSQFHSFMTTSPATAIKTASMIKIFNPFAG